MRRGHGVWDACTGGSCRVTLHHCKRLRSWCFKCYLALIALMKEYFKRQFVCLSYSRKLAQATYLKYKLRQKFVFHSTNHHQFFMIVFLYKLCIAQPQMSSAKFHTFFTCLSLSFNPLLTHKYNYRLDVHLLMRQSSQQYWRLSKWPNMLVLQQTLTENLSLDFYNRISSFWNQHSFIHHTL